MENQLRPTYRSTFRSLITDIKQAAQQSDYDVIALKSPEAYRMLVEALDTSNLKIPAEVSLLDYVGFRYLAVLHAKPNDWPALEHAATYAKENWSAIRSKVTDKSLRDAVDVTMDGLMQACIKQNTDMALFAAQVDLAQVDLLEAFFANTGT